VEYQSCTLEEATDFMCDVETTGLRGDRHALIQVAVLPFRLYDKKICPTYFDRCLRIPPTRSWQESTRDWWYGKNAAVLKGILSRSEDPKEVMQALNHFFSATKQPNARFWMKRPFDWQFVESYFHDTEIANPLRYTNVHEMMAYLKGANYPNESLPAVSVAVDKTDTHDAHNAYYDVLVQVQKLFKTLEKIEEQRLCQLQ
jgi:hypothetical protein